MSKYTVLNVPIRPDVDFEVLEAFVNYSISPDTALVYRTTMENPDIPVYCTVVTADRELSALVASIIADVVVPLEWVTA